MRSEIEEAPKPSHSIPNERMIDLLCKVMNYKTTREDLVILLKALTGDEWRSFHQIAWQQDFAPLLYRRLKELGSAVEVPRDIIGMLHGNVLTVTKRNMLMLHGAGLILKELRSKNLDVIPLKGLYLVENVYTDISLRSFSDLDLLMHKEDLDTAIASLQGLGYHLETYYSTQDSNQDIKHVPPMSKQDGQLVEIHWTILEENEPLMINTDGLWRRAMPANVAGVEVISLSIEDLLLHLSIHLGFQHHLKIGLRGLYDIVEVLHLYQGQVDWKKLIETSREWGAERVISLVLKLAETLLGAEIPLDVFPRLMDEPVPEKILTDARLQLINGQGRVMVITPDLARLTTTKGFGAKVKVMLSRVFIPRQSLARLYNISPRSPAIIWCYFRRFRDLVKYYGPVMKPVLNKDKAVMEGVTAEQKSEQLTNWMTKAR